MCGIAGYLSNTNSTDKVQKSCEKMLKLISHRGPDEKKIITKNNFSCGVVRLSIESIENGSQPIEDENFIIGFNGEIFNYKDLISEYFPKKNINSEVRLLLELWKKKKLNFINLLNGQFAIFIYEKKKNELYLFRDCFGIRPLFFFNDNNRTLFSSEIKSIISVLEKDIKIDEKSLMQISMFWTNVGDQTSFKDIFSLKPGHYLYKKK